MAETCEADEPRSPPTEKALSESNRLPTLATSLSDAEDGSPDAALRPPKPPAPYTVFTRRQKRLLTSVLILTMLASPLTATIYLPLLPLLAVQFNVSNQSINLTITIYVLFQAISPLLFATASDSFGRRPIYLITYAVYTVASLGLALNKHSYTALLILRALQSLGASAVLAIAFGIVADVCPPAERGAMLGPTQGAANLAVCLGPVIGGWVALASGGFEWVFWALLLFGVTVFIVIGIALPETARNVVGNGSIEATGWSRTWSSMVMPRKRNGCNPDEIQTSEEGTDCRKGRYASQVAKPTSSKRHKFKMANPMAALRIIFYKDTALVLWIAASPYAVWYCVQASIPTIYKDIYAFNEFQIGLSYLTGGFGTVLGGYANGKLMDMNYKIVARKIRHTIDRVSGDDLEKFPIERARARGSWCLLLCYIGALTGYGWSIDARAHKSIPLILQFLLAALCTSFQQTFNTLLVDIFPRSPSTAAASSNITRCLLSAIAVAALQPLVNVIGRNWFFTMLAISSGGGGLAADWATKRYGMQWRLRRLAKTRESEDPSGTASSRHSTLPTSREKLELHRKVCHIYVVG